MSQKSKKPINWKTPDMYSPPIKKSNFDELPYIEARKGSPYTRPGMFNNSAPLTPPMPESANPPLLVKATTDPQSGRMLAGKQKGVIGRKRDSSGQFATQRESDDQTTAQDDARAASEDQKRAHDRYASFRRSLGLPDLTPRQKPVLALPQNQMQQGSPMPGMGQPPMDQAQPGMPPDMQAASPGMPGGQEQLGMQEPSIGQTSTGQPIYPDPYHEGHSDFSPQDHSDASNMHIQQADSFTNMGQIPESMNSKQKADIHQQLAQDMQSPAERGMAGIASQPDMMDQFLSQLHQGPDQNKPQGTAASGMRQGPMPGMHNTFTGQPTAQPTPQNHAGTMPMPQAPPPPPTDGSMPSIEGQGMDQDMDQDPGLMSDEEMQDAAGMNDDIDTGSQDFQEEESQKPNHEQSVDTGSEQFAEEESQEPEHKVNNKKQEADEDVYRSLFPLISKGFTPKSAHGPKDVKGTSNNRAVMSSGMTGKRSGAASAAAGRGGKTSQRALTHDFVFSTKQPQLPKSLSCSEHKECPKDCKMAKSLNLFVKF